MNKKWINITKQNLVYHLEGLHFEQTHFFRRINNRIFKVIITRKAKCGKRNYNEHMNIISNGMNCCWPALHSLRIKIACGHLVFRQQVIRQRRGCLYCAAMTSEGLARLNAFWVYVYANAALLAPSVVFFSRHEYLRCGKKGLTLLRSPTAFRDSRAISTLQFPYKSMPLSLNSDRKENFKLNSE